MRNKVTAISALAAGIVLATGGVASADDSNTRAHGGDGFSSGPIVVNGPQGGFIVHNGTLIDLRCAAPDGISLDDAIGVNTDNAQCNTGKVDQSHNAPYRGGLLI
jgi:hypothetical protein